MFVYLFPPLDEESREHTIAPIMFSDKYLVVNQIQPTSYLVLNQIHKKLLPRWCGGKESTCQCRRHRRCSFQPISWNRKWQPTPVFLTRKHHGQGSLAGYSPWGHKETEATEHSLTHTHTHTHVCVCVCVCVCIFKNLFSFSTLCLLTPFQEFQSILFKTLNFSH